MPISTVAYLEPCSSCRPPVGIVSPWYFRMEYKKGILLANTMYRVLGCAS